MVKGYTWLLKHDTPFLWDTAAQESFEHLKALLVSTPLLRPPDYHRDYTLYLAAAYHHRHGSSSRQGWWYWACRLLSQPQSTWYGNSLFLCLEIGIGRCLCRPMFPPLYIIAHYDSDFWLQPNDVHFVMSITGGKILKVDCHPSRVWLGVHHHQFQEVPRLHWVALLSTIFYRALSVRGPYSGWNSVLD